MNIRPISFVVSGEIRPARNAEEVFGSLAGLLKELQDPYNRIDQEAERELKEEFKILPGFQSAKVNIRFFEGSILVTGMVIIDVLGKIAKAVSFFEYLSRTIQFVLKRVVEKRVPPIFTAELTATPVSIPFLTESGEANQDNAFSSFGINPLKFLIYVTILNLALFVGGTVFNGIYFKSAQEKYEEANRQLSELKTQYDSSAKKLREQQSSYVINLESNVAEIISKKENTLSRLSNDTINISGRIEATDAAVDRLNWQVRSTEDSLGHTASEAGKLSASLRQLRLVRPKFAFKDIWESMNSSLKILFGYILVIILLSTLHLIAVIFIRGFRN